MDEGDPAAVFAHRLRAGVVAFLMDREVAAFTEIAEVLGVANNSLSGHLTRLEAAGLVKLERGFLGRKPRTLIRLTTAGRDAWLAWLDQIGRDGVVNHS